MRQLPLGSTRVISESSTDFIVSWEVPNHVLCESEARVGLPGKGIGALLLPNDQDANVLVHRSLGRVDLLQRFLDLGTRLVHGYLKCPALRGVTEIEAWIVRLLRVQVREVQVQRPIQNLFDEVFNVRMDVE